MNTNLATDFLPAGFSHLNSLLPLGELHPHRAVRIRHRIPHTMLADATRIRDCWVLNLAQARQIEAHVTLSNDSARVSRGQLKMSVVEPVSQKVLASLSISCELGPGTSHSVSRVLSTPQAQEWSFANQNLYRLVLTWRANRSHTTGQRKELEFGFLEFGNEGVGQDALFRTRNRSARLRAVIPWSCWTMDGLSPVSSLGGATGKRRN